MKKLVALIVLGVGLAAAVAWGQGPPSNPSLGSPLPTFHFPVMTFTATGQTKTQGIGGVSTATVQVFGTALSTVTWQILASNDAGVHYYPIPTSTGAYTSNTLNVATGAPITTTSAALYYVNLAGFDHYEVITSSTFTATNVSVVVTASSNKGIL